MHPPGPFPTGAALVAYLRDSGHEDQELSLTQQENAILEWAAQHGYTITRIFRDTAPGSRADNRPQFQEMIRYLRAHPKGETGLVIWKWNRFARQIDDAQYYRAFLRRNGIIIHSLTDAIPTGPEGRVFETLLDWMNQRYLEDLAADVKRGLRQLVTQHRAVPGNPPWGFQRVPITIAHHRDGRPRTVHRWEPDPALVPTVRKAFQMRAAGASYRTISETLGLTFSTTTLSYIFRNPIYKGELHYADLIIPDYCTPIVAPETWETVQARHRQHKRIQSPTHPRRHRSPYLLSGRVYCARCGRPLQGHTSIRIKNGKRYEYQRYVCPSARRGQCTAPAIHKTDLETAVLEEIRKLITPETLAPLLAEHQAQQQKQRQTAKTETQKIARALAAAERRITNLTNAIANAGPTESLLEALQKAEDERRALRAQQRALTADDYPIIPDPEAWAAALRAAITEALAADETETLRALIHTLIERVEIERLPDPPRLRGVLYLTLPLENEKSTTSDDGSRAYTASPRRESNPRPTA